MSREVPAKLLYFFKNALKDVDDGFEYASELGRLLNSDDCQRSLGGKEIEALRDFAAEVKKSIGEIDHYSEEKLKAIEMDHFGARGILGYLGVNQDQPKPKWPF